MIRIIVLLTIVFTLTNAYQAPQKQKSMHILASVLPTKNIQQIIGDYLDNWELCMRLDESQQVTALHINNEKNLVVACGEDMLMFHNKWGVLRDCRSDNDKQAIHALTYSIDEKLLASAPTTDIDLWLREPENNKFFRRIKALKKHDSDIVCIAFSPCTKYIASASGDGCIKIWDCALGSCLKTIKMGTILETALTLPTELHALISSYVNDNIANIKKISYSACGSYIFVCLLNGQVTQWPADSADNSEPVDLFAEITHVKDIRNIILGYAGTCWYEKQCAHCIVGDSTHNKFACSISPNGMYVASAQFDDKQGNIEVHKNQAKEIEADCSMKIEEI